MNHNTTRTLEMQGRNHGERRKGGRICFRNSHGRKNKRQRRGTPAVSADSGLQESATRATLLFVAVETVDRSDGAEEAVLFIVYAGSEKQSVCRSGAGVIAERERPQSVNGQDGVVRILQEAHEFVGEAVKRGDPTTAEVAHENGVAELTEIARGPNNSPGCIQPSTMLKMSDVLSSGREDFNKAQTVACHVIVSGGVLLGISDEEEIGRAS